MSGVDVATGRVAAIRLADQRERPGGHRRGGKGVPGSRQVVRVGGLGRRDDEGKMPGRPRALALMFAPGSGRPARPSWRGLAGVQACRPRGWEARLRGLEGGCREDGHGHRAWSCRHQWLPRVRENVPPALLRLPIRSRATSLRRSGDFLSIDTTVRLSFSSNATRDLVSMS